MQAGDVMTTEVITVDERTPISAVAKLLAERGISAVPVVDAAKRVIGMVSEGDLLHRAETGTERRRAWWLDLLAASDELARDYVKSHAKTVGEVMTRDVVSVTEETPVADIAILLETRGIKRVPVLRDSRLVGIVSRANLVQALAMTISEAPTGAAAGDAAIRERLLAELKEQPWAEVAPANVTVRNGVVHLWNSYVSDDEKRALLVAARNIPGVRRVEDHMRKIGVSEA
jgi:CBS domain-containing protein